MTRNKRLSIVLAFSICVGAVLLVAIFGLRTKSATGSLFERVVIQPIPRSVKNIHVARPRNSLVDSGARTYVLRFDIAKEDVSKILRSDTFTELDRVEYAFGVLHYAVVADGTVQAAGIELYETAWRRAPSWFGLPQWTSFEAYIAEKETSGSRYKARLLFYNEEVGVAYFVEHEVTGSWGGVVSVTNPRRSQPLQSMRKPTGD